MELSLPAKKNSKLARFRRRGTTSISNSLGSGPTILVVWVTILAFGSMNIVWGEVQNLQEEDTFTVEVNGLQWYWDFYYHDELTWEEWTLAMTLLGMLVD